MINKWLRHTDPMPTRSALTAALNSECVSGTNIVVNSTHANIHEESLNLNSPTFIAQWSINHIAFGAIIISSPPNLIHNQFGAVRPVVNIKVTVTIHVVIKASTGWVSNFVCDTAYKGHFFQSYFHPWTLLPLYFHLSRVLTMDC